MNRHLSGPNRHNSSLKVVDFIQSDPESAESDIVLEAMVAVQKEMEFIFPLNSVRIFPIGPTADGCEAKTSGLHAIIVLNEKFPDEWDD
ncbi:unnamed protein product, partial [Mesorhabditis belari]|uniref:Uncharacterized protein n=1 Tax=Mesorhabditis belari TaxID=2138241 RepID=A0AAF3EDB3_9BILA